ncbi:MAG: MMPL family transporter [Flavobacteriales bacterium]|nr:MMPL family transporter [Flavobacteriales bacterium]
MWLFLTGVILRNRIAILVIIALITGFMGFKASQNQVTYQFLNLLPADHEANIVYQNFKDQFQGESVTMLFGVDDSKLFELETFNQWYDLEQALRKIDGVDTVGSICSAFNIYKNKELKLFKEGMFFPEKPTSQKQLDSLLNVIRNLPVFEDMLYKEDADNTIMFVLINKKIFDSQDRVAVLEQVDALSEGFEQRTGIQIRRSGLPQIRNVMLEKIRDEMALFIILAGLITALLLYFFVRSLKSTLISLLVVAISVVWCFGTVSIFQFQITALLALVPPIIIVIGIPNCIFLMNKYHREYKEHGNQVKALSVAVQKIGNATLMTNVTTASGFIPFIFIESDLLSAFGVIASINIMVVFFMSITMLPIIFSFSKPPKARHTKHLDSKTMARIADVLEDWVINRRKTIYAITVVLIGIGIWGMSRIEKTGNLAGDLMETDQVIIDLNYFEDNYNGVIPLEILIDTKKKKGAMTFSNLRKMDKLHDLLGEYDEFSRPVSMVDAIKMLRQAYHKGNPEKYALPSKQEMSFIFKYINNSDTRTELLNAYRDSTEQIARISARMADIGTDHMNKLLAELKPRIDSIYNPEKYDVQLTGATIVFLKGTDYLVENLLFSLLLAIIIISCLMALLFSSIRIVLVSLVPNLIPLLLTAAIMGFYGISIKPSTILVFSIAFGISVDDTIHFLAKYRQELKSSATKSTFNAVINALRETCVSMIYTSIVLFFGFGIFVASDFGGNVALGLLVSIALMIAMVANLTLLPALLLTFGKAAMVETFGEPFLEILDEDEDIELDALEIERKDDKTQ